MGAGVLITALTGSGQAGGLAWSEAAAAFAAALLHEGGHLLAAAVAVVRVESMTLDLFGARLALGGLISYGQEFAVAAGGPCVNLLTAALLMPLWVSRGAPSGGALHALILASLGLSAVNLLPVRTLDGGRMLSCFCGVLAGDGSPVPPRLPDRLLSVTTAAVLGIVWLLSAYALLRADRFLSLFAFSFCLLCRVITGERAGLRPAPQGRASGALPRIPQDEGAGRRERRRCSPAPAGAVLRDEETEERGRRSAPSPR